LTDREAAGPEHVALPAVARSECAALSHAMREPQHLGLNRTSCGVGSSHVRSLRLSEVSRPGTASSGRSSS